MNFSGNGLDANQILAVLFDGNHVIDVNTDGGGSFSIQLVIPDNAAAGTHQVCVSESNGNLCSGFTVEAAPASTPTPSTSPSPSPSPSPSGGTSPAVPGSGGGGSTLALLTKPPFVFLPIIAALGLLAFLGLYLWRARPVEPIGEVTILHRAPEPHAFEHLPEAPAPEPPPIVYESPAGPAPHAPPVPPPAPPSGADIPPDLPEASD